MRLFHTLKNRKHREEKGFTLVEVIVVLVILAVLAAILIPALIGYIDKANDKAVISNGSYALKAAQTVASEQYADKKTPTVADVKTFLDGELPGDITAMTVAEGKVSTTAAAPFAYTEGERTAVFANGKWTVLSESPAVTATKTAFNALSDYYKNTTLYQNKKDIDSIALSDPNSFAAKFYNDQPPEIQSILGQGIWKIKNDDTFGVRVFFTTEEYENGTQNVTVYKYDPEKKQFQKTTKAAIDTNGKISANTTDWSDWSTKMD